MQFSALRGLAAVLLFAGAALQPLPACAHAIVVSSSPVAEAKLLSGNAPVVVRFNSRIDRERSRLTLVNPDGSSVNLPLDPSATPDSLIGRVVGLKPGHYRLRWQVLAIDGHITRGDIPFDVEP